MYCTWSLGLRLRSGFVFFSVDSTVSYPHHAVENYLANPLLLVDERRISRENFFKNPVVVLQDRVLGIVLFEGAVLVFGADRSHALFSVHFSLEQIIPCTRSPCTSAWSRSFPPMLRLAYGKPLGPNRKNPFSHTQPLIGTPR